MEYKVFDERDGTEIEDDECLIEFGKLGGPIIIGLQWQTIATTAPTPVAETVSQPTAPTASASTASASTASASTASASTASASTASASTIAPSTLAAPIVDTSITSQASEIQEVDDISASSPYDIAPDIGLGTSLDTGESSNITSVGGKDPPTRKRSFFEQIMSERKKPKTDGKNISMVYTKPCYYARQNYPN